MKGTILFISPSAYPIGGVATWLDYVSKGLQEKDWRVVVGLASGKWHDAETYREKHGCLTVRPINNNSGSREGRIRAIEDIIKRVNPELVVGVNIPDCYIAALRSRAIKVWPKIVMTVHAIQPDFYEDIRKYSEVLDGVICTNKLACELAKVDSGFNEKQIYYAPYGVSVNSKNNIIRAPGDPLRLAYVGRLEQWQKRIHDLLPILAHLEDAGINYQLLIAGTGPEETWIKSQFGSRIEKQFVQFLGEVQLHEMNKIVYDRTDALIVTSAWETGPINIWEAMASRVPVVTSQYIGSGLENVLSNNKNCLTFTIGNTRQAAECIMQLLDRSIREKIVRGGHRLVTTKYNKKLSVEAWDRCFTSILVSSDNKEGVKQPLTITPGGRLDRIFGIRLGETIRCTFDRRYAHQSAGSEWPHSYGIREVHDSSFWSMARRLDEVAAEENSQTQSRAS